MKNVAVFSSSSEHDGYASDNSIKSGALSMSAIDKNLASHDVLISLLTPESVKRPWVVFEAGVGFGKGKAFVPILCRDGKLNSLPKPFSDLFVREASSKQKFNTILKEIDKALGYKHTNVGVEELRKTLCDPMVSNSVCSPTVDGEKTDEEKAIRAVNEFSEQFRRERERKEEREILRMKQEPAKSDGVPTDSDPHPESYVPSSKGNEISDDIDDNSISHD